MLTINLLVVLILFSAFPALLLQQIFENEATCKYFTHNNITDRKDQQLQIKNKLWTIMGSGRNSAIKVLLSPCGDPIPPTMGCGPDAAVCILNTKNHRKSVLNAGRYFNYTIDEEKSENILRSVDGQPCSQDENYTVILEFDCAPHMKTTPTFLYKDDCELRIGMMKPTCTPTCSTRMGGNLIDLRPLQSLGSIAVQEPSTKRSFVLSFCIAAEECRTSDSVSACETTGGSNVATANLNLQQITYDTNKNNLVVKSHFGTSKRIRKNTEIHIKCNWTVQGVANLKYIVPATQGRNYKFEGESSLACIKLPMNCVVQHHYENYLVYNITSLNKQSGNWKVGNVNFGKMYMNMCGPLHLTQPNGNNCSDQYSQVCYINGTRQYVNLGSIPVEFHVTSEDIIQGKFVDGSVCDINKSLTYSTEVELSCSGIEKGPILEAVNDCTYKIKWETPAACSKQFVTSENCQLSDITGNNINLSSFYRTSDRIYNFSQTSYLRYNLCGPLNKPCKGNEHAGICYVKNGKEYIVGFSSTMLTLDNTLLSLNLQGDKCDTQIMRMTTIYFHCKHSAPANGDIRINMVKDGCLFEMNIDTPLVCASPSTTNCKVYNDNFLFNLTPLSRNDSNYLVQDSNSDAVYIVNVCRSVVNSGEYLCPTGTGACMQNLTERHIHHRYLSMGNVNSGSAPTFENGELVIRYSHGSYCPEADTLKRSTVIHFRCSNHEKIPRLLKKDSCSHEFVWQTRNACGKQVLSMKTRSTDSICKYPHPHTGKLIDFSRIHKILHVKTEPGDVYKFSVCENNYTHCTSNDSHCETIESTAQLLSNETDPYLEYPLKNPCINTETQANKLRIHLKCDPFQDNEHFNISGISNCTFHINLLTNLACTSKESALHLPAPTKTQLVEETTKEYDFQNDQVTSDQKAAHIGNTSVIQQIYHNTTSSNETEFITKDMGNNTSSDNKKRLLIHPSQTTKQNNCAIKSNETSFSLNLENIKPISVNSSTGINYAVTLNKPSSNCGGYICKNDLQIVLETDECPAIQFNHTSSMIKLLYNSYQVCDNGWYHSELWLKCNSTVELPSVFKEEKCSVVIIYALQEACLLLESAESYSNKDMAIYSTVSLLIIAISTIGGLLIFRKYPPKICSRFCYQQIPEDKESVRVYFKFSNLMTASHPININLTHNNISTVNFDDAEVIAKRQGNFSPYFSGGLNRMVYLDGNPINCNCYIYHFARYFDHTIDPLVPALVAFTAENLTCASPSDFIGFPIKKLRSSMITCSLQQSGIEADCPEKCSCTFRPWDESVIFGCMDASLTEVPKLTLPKHFFYQTEVHLQRNLLTSGPKENMGYENVTKLFLFSNNINEVTWIPPKVKVLELDNNNINYLNDNVLAMLNASSLTNLTLGNNPFNCDCWAENFNSYLVLQLLNEKVHIDVNNITCSSGEEFVVHAFTNNNYQCPPYADVLIGFSVTFFLVILGISVMMVFYLWGKKNSVQCIHKVDTAENT